MKNNGNATIVLLTLTAAIMTGMLISTWTGTQEPASAVTSMKDGAYVLCTGAWSDTLDVLYVIDIATGTLKAYAVDMSAGGPGTIRDLDTVPLSRLFMATR